jgi:hypothetical protein
MAAESSSSDSCGRFDADALEFFSWGRRHRRQTRQRERPSTRTGGDGRVAVGRARVLSSNALGVGRTVTNKKSDARVERFDRRADHISHTLKFIGRV